MKRASATEMTGQYSKNLINGPSIFFGHKRGEVNDSWYSLAVQKNWPESWKDNIEKWMSVLELPSKIHYLYGLSRKKNSLTKVQKMIKKVVAHWRICRHDPAIKSENGYRLASLHWVVFRVTFLLPRHHFGVHFRTKRAMLLLLRNERASHI